MKIYILLSIVSTFIFIASLVQYIIALQSLHVLEVLDVVHVCAPSCCFSLHSIS